MIEPLKETYFCTIKDKINEIKDVVNNLEARMNAIEKPATENVPASIVVSENIIARLEIIAEEFIEKGRKPPAATIYEAIDALQNNPPRQTCPLWSSRNMGMQCKAGNPTDCPEGPCSYEYYRKGVKNEL